MFGIPIGVLRGGKVKKSRRIKRLLYKNGICFVRTVSV